MVIAGYDKNSIVSNRAKGGSFASIGVTKEPKGLPTITKGRDSVCTVARCAMELQRSCGYGETR
jgi:hypothetical protein